MLSHKNILTNIKANVVSLQLTENDYSLIALPMYFSYCNTAQFLSHLYLGSSMVIMDGIFLPNKFLGMVEKEKITNFFGVPSLLVTLLSYRGIHKYNISSLRAVFIGGGKIAVEKLKQLIELFKDIEFYHTYGLTEASPRVTTLTAKDAICHLGSIGKPIPGVQTEIIDECGVKAKAGKIGELIVKGDSIMKGYYKRPDITNETIKNGWLYTGDLATSDKEGFIYLVGRRKNIIINGGINIYPEEIEELLLCHQAVKEVCVSGEEDERFGEVPVARVVLQENIMTIPTENDLINYCAENLAEYKIPSKIIFVEELNKTATGKIKRKK